MIRRFVKDKSGATALEYGLIVALVAVVAVGAIASVGNTSTVQLNTVASKMK
jgi:pilus assembly protein Flp/PilA